MPDLADGESVEMKGSAATPYVIKNTGGVYSCSCPAWRNQSTAIEQRTCKHIRKLRGDEAENERIGTALPQKPVKKAATSDDQELGSEPPILLAESWDNALDLAGWWMSEKLDGVRAFWDGTQFLSRQGNLYHAPDWFIDGLPNVPLDGELWIDRKAFQRTVSIVRRQDKNDLWSNVRYRVFDAPTQGGKFEERLEFLQDGSTSWKNDYLQLHPHELCRDVAHLREELARIESLGGEGLMLREPGSLYVAGRSTTLLKVKTFHDAEATVIGHEPGRGKHSGRLGALVVQLPNGKQFSVGTGFSDKERSAPPSIGSLIQFRYQELSDAGIPRFPSYVGLRTDIVPTPKVVKNEAALRAVTKLTSQEASSTAPPKPASSASIAPSSGSRRFEFVEGSSSKFWEISRSGCDVTTRWGKIGTEGQTKTKPFSTAAKAEAEYDKLIAEKTGKGYVEVGDAVTALNEVVESASAALAASETAQAVTQLEPSDSAVESGHQVDALRAVIASMPDGRAKVLMQDRLEELISLFEVPEPEPVVSATPMKLQLQPITDAVFDNAAEVARLSKAISRAGFTLVGDFTIRAMPVKLRAYLRSPDTFAVINEYGPYLWVELNAHNADNTSESWSNVPVHDGQDSPWTTAVRDPQADFNKLHAMLLDGRSDKEPAQFTLADFAGHFERAYARAMQWRESAKQEQSRAVATSSGAATSVIMSASSVAEAALASSSTTVAKPELLVSKEIEELVLKFADEFHSEEGHLYPDLPPENVESGKLIMKLKPEKQVEVLRACILFRPQVLARYRRDILDRVRTRLIRRKLPFTQQDICLLACELCEDFDKIIIAAIEDWAKSHALPAAAAMSLRTARENAPRGEWSGSEVHLLKARIDVLVGDDATRNPIEPTEVWAIEAIKDVEAMLPEQRRSWTRLLQCCVAADSAKPTDKWLQSAAPLMEAITRDEFLKSANRWLPSVDKRFPEDRTGERFFEPLSIYEGNQLILRGLVWCCSLAEDSATTRTLGNLARTCFKTVPGVGPRSGKVGNAVVFTLGAMSIPDAVAQLAILKVKVKNGTAQRFIEAELKKAAERLGITREELEEMSVPAYGLEEVGLRRDELGDFIAELSVDSTGSTELKWHKSDGSFQKSVPAKVQQDFAEDLKELKAAAKDIQNMVSVQRERIDSLFLNERQWPYSAWLDRYLNHPLVGIIARRLLWVFKRGESSAVGAYFNGKVVGLDDAPLTTLDDETQVALWHPIGRSIEEIVAWREWLERHSITQPFKQAHREIYIITDAERQTSVYSNRFAAHVLRQSQLRSLAQGRGWQTKLLGRWDAGGDAHFCRFLPHWNVSAQYWVTAIYDEVNGAVDIPESAGVPFVSTDQVRFYRGKHNEYAPDTDLLPLASVPGLLLSEVMRDVDLFVGVASIGNDPNWQDGGEVPYGHYWEGYAFGDLSESAKTRRQVLERLIPRLKIAARCSFDERFLIVQGDLRTYRIHIGSSNIQMEPNNEYLCIVPKGGPEESMFLPFEGDRMLSIVLSKALLLADDKKIKDPTILSQINQR